MRLTVLTLMLAAAGCNSDIASDTATREEIRNVIRSYHDHLSKGEVEEAAALAAADVSIVVGGGNPAHGKEACLGVWRGFVEVYKEKDLLGRREARYGDIRIDLRDRMAVASYSVTFLEPKGPFHEAYTQLFARDGGRWLLLHEHRAARSTK